MENEKPEIICYEVETYYKSGRRRSDIIAASSEEKMWEIYDKHHNKDLVDGSVIVDAWPQ
jgi:hypothetical protein